MTELKSTVTKPYPRQDIVDSEEMIGKQLFLYAGDDGDEIHCLNGGAAIIWLLCDGVRDVEDIAKEVADEFDLPEHEVIAEVHETIAQFHSLNLLESAATSQ